MTPFQSTALKIENGQLWILDQTRLPQEEKWLDSTGVDDMVAIIRALKVRGAPLIGVAAALQLAFVAEAGASAGEIDRAAETLRASRPTAVNLMNAMDRCLQALHQEGPRAVIAAAESIAQEDVELCASMARHGSALIPADGRVLTHCNTGGLATVGTGTALGVIKQAARDGKNPHVYVDETRPLLQGGRLTTWELEQNKIPYTLICDNMAAYLMQKEKVDCVLVGADRIARNGDFANKVGTYNLAVLCKFHSVPFYVVAPQTTVDPKCAHGEEIPVEERSADEVRGVRQEIWAPRQSPVWNPAFDVTPEALVTGWVLDRGVFDRADVNNGALLGE
jgi:methylthioribose-1-phosphate isomerase